MDRDDQATGAITRVLVGTHCSGDGTCAAGSERPQVGALMCLFRCALGVARPAEDFLEDCGDAMGAATLSVDSATACPDPHFVLVDCALANLRPAQFPRLGDGSGDVVSPGGGSSTGPTVGDRNVAILVVVVVVGAALVVAGAVYTASTLAHRRRRRGSSGGHGQGNAPATPARGSVDRTHQSHHVLVVSPA